MTEYKGYYVAYLLGDHLKVYRLVKPSFADRIMHWLCGWTWVSMETKDD